MMGVNHVTSGVIAGAATLPLLPDPTATTAAAWVMLCGGFALICDLDCPSSSSARMWGPITRLLAEGVSAASGGHRWATHDAVLAPAAVAGLAAVAASNRIGLWMLTALATGLVIQGMGLAGLTRRAGPAVNLALSALVGWWVSANPPAGSGVFLGVAAAIGVLAHIAGDALTPEKVPVPLLWIWNRARFGLPVFSVDSLVERWIVAPILVGVMLWVLWQRADSVGWGAHLALPNI